MWDKSIIFDTYLAVVGCTSFFIFYLIVHLKQTDKRDRNPVPLIHLLHTLIITRLTELLWSTLQLNEQRSNLDILGIAFPIFPILFQLYNLGASTSNIKVRITTGWQAYPLSWSLIITCEMMDIVKRTPADGSVGFRLARSLGFPFLRCVIILALVILLACPGLAQTKFAAFMWPSREGQIKLGSDSSNKDDEQEATVAVEITEAGGLWPWMKKSRFLWKYIWPSNMPNKWIYLLTASVLAAANATISIWVPGVTGWYMQCLVLAVDREHDLDIGALFRNTGLMACIQFSTSVYGLPGAQQWVWDNFSRHREKHARDKFHETIMKKDASFHNSVDPSDIRSGIDKAISAIELPDFILFSLLPESAQLLGTMFIAIPLYGVKFGQVLFVIVAINLYIVMSANNHLILLNDIVNAANTKSKRTAQDSLQGWSTVAVGNRFDSMIGMHKNILDGEYQRKSEVANYSAKIGLLISFMTEYGQLIGTVVTVLYGRHHGLSSRAILAFPSYWTNIAKSLYFLGTIHQRMALNLVAARELRKLLEIEPIAQYGNEELRSYKGDIVFKNLTYGYVDVKTGKKKEVGKRIDVTIEEGTNVSVVGPSGSGKSTLLRALDGSCPIMAGYIYYAGQDLSKLKHGERAKLVTSLQQKSALFSMTFKENINFFSDDRKQEHTERAAKHACIDDFIKKQSEGYDSTLNENQLSGGEKQRMWLARIFATETPVLCLDEPTCSLDFGTRSSIEEHLENLPGRTVIQVTHSLETANRSDKIIVLQKGDDGCTYVAEQGSPAELLQAPDSSYAKLWKAYESKRTLQHPVSQNDAHIESLFNDVA